MEWLNNVTALAATNPVMYILTMIFVLIVIASVGSFLFASIKFIFTHFSKVKIGKAELSTDKDGATSTDGLSDSQGAVSVSSLLNLIIDLPDAAISYHNKLNDIKHQLINDQVANFQSELRKYRKNIRQLYCEELKVEIGSDTERLFNYWFSSLFSDIDAEIDLILARNGLNEKTAEQLEDIVRGLYEESYTIIMDGIENAPPFISAPSKLRTIVADKKNDYRKNLEESVNYARKLRIEAESKFQKIKDEYNSARLEIITRDCPSYLEQIKDAVK